MEDAPNTARRVSLFFFDFTSPSLFGVTENLIQQMKILLAMLSSLCAAATSFAIAEIFVRVVDL